MIKISKTLMNYFFAKDISDNHDYSMGLFQEFNLEHSRDNEDYLKAARSSKIWGVLSCSALPNLIHCAGLGLSLYVGNIAPLCAASLTAEAERNFFRQSAKREIKEHNAFMLFLEDKCQMITSALGEAR